MRQADGNEGSSMWVIVQVGNPAGLPPQFYVGDQHRFSSHREHARTWSTRDGAERMRKSFSEALRATTRVAELPGRALQ